MLHYTSLVYLLLLVSVASSYHAEYKAGPGKHFLIAPESHGDHSNFAVAEYDDPYSLPPKFSVTIRVFNDSHKDQPKECSLKFQARWEAITVGVSSLNRLNANKFVLTWFDEKKDNTYLRTRIVVIDMDNKCKRTYLEHSDVSGRVIVVPIPNQNKFDLFVDDGHTCLGNGDRCRIYYNLDSNFLGLRRPFHDKFDWSTVNFERLPNEDLVVRGDIDGEFQIMRVYHDGTSPILDRVKYGRSELDFVSTGMSYCWMNTTHSYNKVNCTVFDNRNELDYVQIVTFPEPRKIIDVFKVSVDNRDNALALITKMKYCGDNCWTMYSTIVREDRRPEHEKRLFQCTGNQKDLVVFGANYDQKSKKIDFNYACKNGDKYNFNM